MFGVGWHNAFCSGIVFKHAANKLFLKDLGGPENDFDMFCSQVQWFD